MSTQYVHYEVNILLTCILILFFQSFLLESRLIKLYHVMHHVITITCLFIIQEKRKQKEKQKKRNIKSRKINKKNVQVQVHYNRCEPYLTSLIVKYH